MSLALIGHQHHDFSLEVGDQDVGASGRKPPREPRTSLHHAQPSERAATDSEGLASSSSRLLSFVASESSVVYVYA